jgi:hypothetical protein
VTSNVDFVRGVENDIAEARSVAMFNYFERCLDVFFCIESNIYLLQFAIYDSVRGLLGIVGVLAVRRRSSRPRDKLEFAGTISIHRPITVLLSLSSISEAFHIRAAQSLCNLL